jgi:hypothetical protein
LDDVVAAASTSSRPEGAVVAAASESSRAGGVVVAATPRSRTSGQVQWGALANRRLRRELTPTRLRPPTPPPRPGSPSPSGSSDKQSDEAELSAEERSFENQEEQELDGRESAQRIHLRRQRRHALSVHYLHGGVRSFSIVNNWRRQRRTRDNFKSC